jgi:translation initiation factor 3 subunit H
MATYKSPVECVQIDGLVVLKIIKHCQEEGSGGSELVQGVLLGLVDKKCLEVTNCFPFPRHTDEEDFDEVSYQLEMMKNLRHVNVDHLHVGWYQSTNFGTYVNKPLVDSQFNYQFSIDESIVLIYDPVRTAKGRLSLKALRLTPTMMAMYREGDFTQETIKQAGLSFETMFEEVPIKIRNSHLVNALLCEIEEEAPSQDTKYSFLDLSTSSFLEKNLRLLMDTVDDLSQETNKYFNYQRTLAKHQQSKQQYLQKRLQENKLRAERGEPPLPDEDINKLFKPVPSQGRLDSLLLSGQISEYASQMNEFASQTFGKLFVVDSLQEDEQSSSATTTTTHKV